MSGSNQGSRRRWIVALLGCAAVLVLAAALLTQRDDETSAAGATDATTASPQGVAGSDAEPPAPEPEPNPRTRPEPIIEPEPIRIPSRATGRFTVAPGRSPQAGRGSLLRYTVAVERGLPYRTDQVAPVVDATLADRRGWTKDGEHAFQRVGRRPDFRVLLASPATTDRLCAPLRTLGRVSCRNGALVVLNAKRWAYGIPDYDGDLRRYRQYLVNHEVGHVLGEGHVQCPGRGRPAPLMQQQSYGLDGCRPNAWPR